MQPLTVEREDGCTIIFETRSLSLHILVILLYFSIAKIIVAYASVITQSNYWTEQVTILQWAHMDEDPGLASAICCLFPLGFTNKAILHVHHQISWVQVLRCLFMQ